MKEIVPSQRDGESLRRGGSGADDVRLEPLRLEDGEELVARRQRPRVGTVRYQEQPQRGQVHFSVILRRQQAPVEISTLDNRYRRC